MNEFVGFSGRLRRNVLRVGAALPWLLAGVFSGFAVDRAHAAGATTAPCPVLLDRTMARLQDDAPQQLCQYAGRVALVVNTASYCGYTRQYEGLEALFRAYRSRGFVILGFPSNDFGQQEPGSASQIADLCFNTYGVAFPMFAKTVVSGAKADPFFAALAKSAGSAPKWNFHKYLIGRDGKVLAAYPSAIEPNDPTLRRDLERALGR